MEFAGRTLATLGELGIELAVDDFGTGYATFDFVRRVPLHTIKIAGEFMRGMEHDRRDAGIVASVLTLARALDLTAVAEGVETAGPARLPAPRRLPAGPGLRLRPPGAARGDRRAAAAPRDGAAGAGRGRAGP